MPPLSSDKALHRHHPQKNSEISLEMDGQTVCRSGRFAQSRMGMNGCFDLFERRFESDGQTELSDQFRRFRTADISASSSIPPAAMK
jgi:hypothetical protein